MNPTTSTISEQLEKQRKYKRDWYRKNKEKAREWRIANKEKIREKDRIYYSSERGKEVKNKNRLKDKAKGIDKVREHTKWYFKKDKECALCKRQEVKLEFHHWRYRLPVKRKDFSTLCRSCHRIIHIKNKKEISKIKSALDGQEKTR